jgi:hypothetical protein
MTNLPPPDPRSSLGFDELVGVVIAFTAIGTIFLVSLRDKGFSFGNLTPSLTTTTPQASPNATADPTPAEGLPTQKQATPLPKPSAVARVMPGTVIAPTTPNVPATPVTPENASKVTPVVPVQPVAISPSPVKTVTPSPAPVNFSDIPQVFWARPYIEALAKRRILIGFRDGTFRPNQPVTRAQFAAMLQKAFDQKVVMAAPDYKDVRNNFWASSAIQETTRSGFLRGYPGNMFRPNQQISKVQALVSLTKGLGLASTSAPKEFLKIYQDAAEVPKYATDIVGVATEGGLVVNYPNRRRLEPNKTLTRAEAAALTYQAMVKAGKAKAITSEYVAQP